MPPGNPGENTQPKSVKSLVNRREEDQRHHYHEGVPAGEWDMVRKQVCEPDPRYTEQHRQQQAHNIGGEFVDTDLGDV